MMLIGPPNHDSGVHNVVGGVLWKIFAASGALPAPTAVSDDASVARLKKVVLTVTEFSRTTLLDPRSDVLVPKLDAVDEEMHGFAYEGAGVGLAALDCVMPWKGRTRALATGAGARHVFGIYLGAGMCLARIHRNPMSFQASLKDPLLSWVVLDGYGFYQGFFGRQVVHRKLPAGLHGYAGRVYDQGVGRAIWFSGADANRVAKIIRTFPQERQADLWSGAGFACGYSGGIDRAALMAVPAASNEHRAHLAVGAAMSAKARHLGGNPAAQNELACEVLCGMTSLEAASLVDTASQDLPVDHDVPAHALWRQRILQSFA